MLGQGDQVTSSFELLKDDKDKITGITFDFKISAHTDSNRISKQDYDPSFTIKNLISQTLNNRAFKGTGLDLRLTKEIYINGQKVLSKFKLPVYELNLLNTKENIFNNIISTEYKKYIDVIKHPKTDDAQTLTIEFSFTSNK
jgi:hypothetical protein